MNEDEVNNVDQDEEAAWEPPPLPEEVVAEELEQPEMSEAATLGNIFIEPGRTFEDLRRKPRFVMATLAIVFLISIFQVAFIEKYGFKNIATAQLEANPQVQQMDAEAKKQVIEKQTQPMFKYITYGVTPVILIAFIFVGGLILWVSSLALGGKAGYLHGVSTWAYSSFPPTVISILVNFIVMFLKPVEDINLAESQNGLVQANPTFFMNLGEMPVLEAVLRSFDLFAIWGWVLVAIGLQKVAKLSAGAAWGISIILFLVVLAGRTIWALLFG